SGDYVSYYVLDNLKHKLTLGINHKIISKLNADWYILWQDRNGTYTSYVNTVAGSEVPYKPFWTVDTKVWWQLPHGKIFVEASNLFDKKYFDLGNIVQPGRWIRAGISVDLGI
ncbi:MAG: TonB-dependent receptor, partial [Bacteroidota bacterium]|nr:TonB-dependent receptor [Bacteroidota bacterium]